MGNALQTTIRDLHRRRGRERRGLALAEGVRLVEEALAAGVECRAVIVSPALEHTDRGKALARRIGELGIERQDVTDDELAKLAATEHPQGVLAVVVPKPWTLDDVVIGKHAVVVVFDGIQDPGNVGTIIRTAASLGAAAALALPGTAELTNPKTLRASMGALFRLPSMATTEEVVGPWLERHKVTVAATAMDGRPFDPANLPHPVALVFGNEGSGLASALGRDAALKLSIPLSPGADSLNVAVAAGIFLHGACRVR